MYDLAKGENNKDESSTINCQKFGLVFNLTSYSILDQLAHGMVK
jgi:hypothetical protein